MVTATVDMEDGDKDDLYFVMFNILDKPLRFVVAVAGNFRDFLVTKGYTEQEINECYFIDNRGFYPRTLIFLRKTSFSHTSFNLA